MPVSGKILECKDCGSEVHNVGEDAEWVICHECCRESYIKQFPDDVPNKKPQKSGKPQGWHFMTEFVDADGNVFYKGKEQPDLKGTLPPTEIGKKNPTKRLSKKEKFELKQKLLVEYSQLKKELMKAKYKYERKDIGKQMKKIEKQLKKL